MVARGPPRRHRSRQGVRLPRPGRSRRRGRASARSCGCRSTAAASVVGSSRSDRRPPMTTRSTALMPIAKVTGHRPGAGDPRSRRVGRARWAGRGAAVPGRRRARPARAVAALPRDRRHGRRQPGSPATAALLRSTAAGVLRLPPACRPCCRRPRRPSPSGPTLVVVPAVGDAARCSRPRLRRAGRTVALVPREWAAGRGRRRRRHRGRGRRSGRRAPDWPRSSCSTSTTRRCRRSAHRPGTPVTSPSSGPGGPACRAARLAVPRRVTARGRGRGERFRCASAVVEERAGWPIVEIVDRTRRGAVEALARDVAADRASSAIRADVSSVCSTRRAGRGCWRAARAGPDRAASCARRRSALGRRRRASSAGAAAPSVRRCARRAARRRVRQPAPRVSRGCARSSRRRPVVRWSRSPGRRRDVPDAGVYVGTEAVLHRVRRGRRRRLPRLRRASCWHRAIRAAEQAMALLIPRRPTRAGGPRADLRARPRGHPVPRLRVLRRW